MPPPSPGDTYSPVGAWTGPKGKWTLTDDGHFTTGTGSKGTWQWKDHARRELGFKWDKAGPGGAVLAADGKSIQVTLPKGGQFTLTR